MHQMIDAFTSSVKSVDISRMATLLPKETIVNKPCYVGAIKMSAFTWS